MIKVSKTIGWIIAMPILNMCLFFGMSKGVGLVVIVALAIVPVLGYSLFLYIEFVYFNLPLLLYNWPELAKALVLMPAYLSLIFTPYLCLALVASIIVAIHERVKERGDEIFLERRARHLQARR